MRCQRLWQPTHTPCCRHTADASTDTVGPPPATRAPFTTLVMANLHTLAGGGNITLGVMMVVGLFLWAVGYRLFRVTVFALGFSAAAAIAFASFGAAGYRLGGDGTPTMLIVSLLVGIVGGFLALAMYMCGIFVIGFFLGVVFGSFVSAEVAKHIDDAATGSATGGAQALFVFIVLGCGLLFGIMALKFQRAIIIVSTSFSGAQNMVAASVCFAAGQGFALDGATLTLPLEAAKLTPVSYAAIWLTLGCIGCFIQHKYTGKGDHHSRRKQKPKVVILDDGASTVHVHNHTTVAMGAAPAAPGYVAPAYNGAYNGGQQGGYVAMGSYDYQ